MRHETLLGFDFGTRFIGVAVGQTVTCTATPLHSISAKQGVPNWAALTALIRYWHPNRLIVGMPFSQDGTYKAITRAAQHFVSCLQDRYALPVGTIDERFSTQSAKQHLFHSGGARALGKTNIDGVSAKIILECALQEMAQKDDRQMYGEGDEWR